MKYTKLASFVIFHYPHSEEDCVLQMIHDAYCVALPSAWENCAQETYRVPVYLPSLVVSCAQLLCRTIFSAKLFISLRAFDEAYVLAKVAC